MEWIRTVLLLQVLLPCLIQGQGSMDEEQCDEKLAEIVKFYYDVDNFTSREVKLIYDDLCDETGVVADCGKVISPRVTDFEPQYLVLDIPEDCNYTSFIMFETGLNESDFLRPYLMWFIFDVEKEDLKKQDYYSFYWVSSEEYSYKQPEVKNAVYYKERLKRRLFFAFCQPKSFRGSRKVYPRELKGDRRDNFYPRAFKTRNNLSGPYAASYYYGAHLDENNVGIRCNLTGL